MYRIKEYRKKKAFRQKDLAEKAGISLNSVRRYEQGLRSPKAEIILKIADSLEVTPNELLGVDEKTLQEGEKNVN